MKPIQAIITDVDGVMVGKTPGVNFPLPHQAVIDRLQRINSSGIPVILCTAKFNFAIREIALSAHLDNPHITDSGAVLINFVADTITSEHPIDRQIVEECVSLFLDMKLYVEIYTTSHYYVQRSQRSSFTEKRNKVLQMQPTFATSLIDIAKRETIVKIICFTKDDAVQQALIKQLDTLKQKVHYIWSAHPFLRPIHIGVITAANISKASASIEVSQLLSIPLDGILGIGDSLSDWEFMQLCGFVGTIGDEAALQEKATTKETSTYYISRSVDDHGILDIFDYFKLP